MKVSTYVESTCDGLGEESQRLLRVVEPLVIVERAHPMFGDNDGPLRHRSRVSAGVGERGRVVFPAESVDPTPLSWPLDSFGPNDAARVVLDADEVVVSADLQPRRERLVADQGGGVFTAWRGLIVDTRQRPADGDVDMRFDGVPGASMRLGIASQLVALPHHHWPEGSTLRAVAPSGVLQCTVQVPTGRPAQTPAAHGRDARHVGFVQGDRPIDLVSEVGGGCMDV